MSKATSTTRPSETSKKETKRKKISRSDLAAIGLGSNVGASTELLWWAVLELERFFGPLSHGPLYKSRPISPIDQDDFFNTVAVGRIGDDAPGPEDLLAFGKALEITAGRRRGARFGPRPLDVDLLVYGDVTSRRPELTLPHPRLLERLFVLAPLADLCPDLALAGRTVRLRADRLADEQQVIRVSWRDGRRRRACE